MVAVGGAAVEPVDDVVDLEVAVVGAAGDAAALVAEGDEAAGAVGDEVAGAADRDGQAVGGEHGAEQAVAADVAANGVGEAGSGGVDGAAGVEVEVDPEPVAS